MGEDIDPLLVGLPGVEDPESQETSVPAPGLAAPRRLRLKLQEGETFIKAKLPLDSGDFKTLLTPRNLKALLTEHPLPVDQVVSYANFGKHVAQYLEMPQYAEGIVSFIRKRKLGDFKDLVSFVEHVEGAPLEDSRVEDPPTAILIPTKLRPRVPVRREVVFPQEEDDSLGTCGFTIPAEVKRLAVEAVARCEERQLDPISSCRHIFAAISVRPFRFTENQDYVRTDSIEDPVDTCLNVAWGNAKATAKDPVLRELLDIIHQSWKVEAKMFPLTIGGALAKERKKEKAIDKMSQKLGWGDLLELLETVGVKIPEKFARYKKPKAEQASEANASTVKPIAVLTPIQPQENLATEPSVQRGVPQLSIG